MLLGNQDIQQIKTLDFNSEVANTASGASTAINWTSGAKQTLLLNANTTLTFTAPAGVSNLLLRIVQGSGAPFTITWPTQGTAAGNVAWAGKTLPTLSTAAGAIDEVALYYNGTFYSAVPSLNFG